MFFLTTWILTWQPAKLSQMSDTSKQRIPKEVKFLFSRLWEHKTWLGFSGICVLIAAAVQVSTSSLIKKFLDDALIPRDWGQVVWFCGAVISLFLVDGLSDFLHRFFIRIAMERSVARIRQELFLKILSYSPMRLSRASSGKAVNLLTADINVLGMGTHITADLMREPVVFLALLGYLFYLNWVLTLVCFVAAPLIGMLGKTLGKSAKRNQKRIQDSLEEISSHVIESMGGLKTAQSYSQTPKLASEFYEKNTRAYSSLIRLARIEESVGPLTKWLTSWVGALLIGFGAFLVVRGHLTTGGLVAFITAAGLLQQPLRQLNHVGVRIQQLAAAGERIYEALHETPDPIGTAESQLLEIQTLRSGPIPVAKSLELIKGELCFENVSFIYPPRSGETQSVFALGNLNLKLEPGKKVALVGRSGSGKSTITQLALRFLDPSTGSIKIGQKSSTDVDLDHWRNHFAYVSQDVYLFHRSILENLLFANPKATRSEVESALAKAQILEFVKNLPHGMDSVLGEKAQTLSGGEKQRLAIARAFLRPSPFLILDEATSQLDAHSEKAVQGALEVLTEGKGVLIVAHRLSTVKNVDEILVLEKGNVIERGHPSDLLQDQSGAFQKLWHSQFERA